MDLQLQGRRVLVTGGSRGIGLSIALTFAREGAVPILVSRSAESLDAAAASIHTQYGIRAEVHALDMGLPGAEAQMLAKAGSFDILVNNAGAIPGGSLSDVDEARWRQAWDLKLFGYINLTRAVLPVMTARGSGVIANIIGMAGAAPRSEYIAGAAANAALMAFTQGLGATSTRSGVRVFGINPSPTRSDRMETMMRAKAASTLGDAERWMELTKALPFGRMAEPREIADMTAFCCSPLASYLSGTVINVDGGQMYASPA
jgi:NAD(P)-dependent dehydrogenase (short-subunit alcohol dehydrogenase family)